jgi:PadR family transcriptional regulator
VPAAVAVRDEVQMTTTLERAPDTLAAVPAWETETEDRARSWQQTEPHLLLLLTRGSAHGYDLLTQLAELGFRSSSADQGAVYRTLRRLEEAGCVVSRWETGVSGPARRIYEITTAGRDVLYRWALALRERRERLERFLDLYSLWTAEQEGGRVLRPVESRRGTVTQRPLPGH